MLKVGGDETKDKVVEVVKVTDIETTGVEVERIGSSVEVKA